ncbi:hypothetical protein BGZ60DRAFT_419120 [Tricladium varicosporioides]|nr:hypothetical protein BGZ60DRAFT_419120 [Hymenoscyphus varicosporioides]
MALVPQYLRADEEAQIHRQFQGDKWRRNNQVLWSGILRDEAQSWANKHEMQTLTTAMGPLMDPSHSLCLQNQKSSNAWGKYVKGASAIFAYYISRGERVTVLSPPPPERFHPSGQTNYQAIEEPIVKGLLGTSIVSQIEMVHPTVKGAEDTYYQIWPVDDTATWTAKFGELGVQKRRWRMVKKKGETKKKEEEEEEKEKAEEEEKAKKDKKKTRKAKKERKKAKKIAKRLEKEKKIDSKEYLKQYPEKVATEDDR